VAGHPEFLVVWCQHIMYKCAKSISFWGLLPSGGLAIRAFGQCPVGRSVGTKSGPLG